jgi:NDP-sugar pyrophosphorylase family protein
VSQGKCTVINRAVVVAVGNAAHHSKLTYNRPRAMLPALGKPLVARVMDRLLRGGVEQYIVIVGENEGGVAAYLDAHWAANASVEFVIQSSKRTLTQALSEIAGKQDAPFMLTSYSSFAHLHFADRLCRRFMSNPDVPLLLSGAGASLSHSPIMRYTMLGEGQEVRDISDHQSDQALILSDFAVCGEPFIRYLIDLSATDEGLQYTDLAAIYTGYVRAGGSAAIVPTSWTLQIESDIDLLTLHRHLLDEEQDAHILSEIPPTAHIIPPVRIDPLVSVGQNARIGPYVYLESGCSIGEGAVVENALILNKVMVGAQETVRDAVIATRAHIRV